MDLISRNVMLVLYSLSRVLCVSWFLDWVIPLRFIDFSGVCRVVVSVRASTVG